MRAEGILNEKRILFFCQFFFDYEKKIVKKMQDLGAEVVLYDEMSVKTSYERALLKVSSSFFNKKTEKYYAEILRQVRNKSFDYVLFIDCEMPTHKVLKAYRSAFKGAKFCLHLWDSLSNLKGVSGKFRFFDFISTFDRNDSIDNNIVFRPLFFSDEYRAIENKKNKSYAYTVSFIGTVHSDRYKIIKRLQESIDGFYLYGYLQGKFIYYYYKIVKPEYRGIKISSFNYKKLSSKAIARIVSDSKAILDIQHPNQTGLTMRTLEMVGMRKKIITTNEDIKNYDFYNPNNICVINRENPVVSKEFLEKDYEELPNSIYEYYSIEKWIVDVLGVQNG